MSVVNYWDRIYGHKNNKNIVDQLLTSSVLPHAFIFIGKEGIGKDFFALQLAKQINSKFTSLDNISHVINGINQLSEPFIKFIYPLPRGKNETDETGPFEKLNTDELEEIKSEINKKIDNPYHQIHLNKANTIKISSIRDINKFLSMQFDESFYRFILISDAHLMNETSQNALLKNLEEPPTKVIFILTTPYPDLLRETIRSRCWNLYFNPLTFEEVSKILVDYFKIDEILAKEVAIFSNGSVSTAIQLLENDFTKLKEETIIFLRYALGRKFHSAYIILNEFIKDGNIEGLKLLIQMIIIWLNDLQKLKSNRTDFYFSDHPETLEKFNKKFPKSDVKAISFKLDYLKSLIINNVHPNLLAANIVYTISELSKSN
ncbi:MAG: AAA family ATPase [Ignavibacteriaceae bacterium]|nr:AAA family ATPase [Ignavibacteriaceae bacterium]